MKTQNIETTLFFIEQRLEYNYIRILLHVNNRNYALSTLEQLL